MREKGELLKLDFNVTNACNFRCLHCCFRSGICAIEDFTTVTLEKILTEFVSLGGKRIDITGGEILMRKDINRVMMIAKGLGIKTEAVTNASLLTDDILKFWQAIGIEAVAISLDGHTAETYNHIRRQDEKTFETVLRNIQRCAVMGFSTKVNTVVFSSNLKIAENITQLAIELGANEHGFYFFSPVGSGERHQREVADPIEWLRIIRTELWKYKDLIKISCSLDRNCFGPEAQYRMLHAESLAPPNPAERKCLSLRHYGSI